MTKVSLKVLITCGPTWAPLDDVRVISNISSGEMGHLIAQVFSQQKHKVTLIEGPVTHEFKGKVHTIIKYRFFDELAKALNQELQKKYDIVVHAAAVSDFKVKGALVHKISSAKPLNLHLVKTPKLIKDIKRRSPESFLVGFKLEPDLTLKNVFEKTRLLFTEALCDLVVANTLKKGYQGFMVDADGKILGKANNKQDLAKQLVNILSS